MSGIGVSGARRQDASATAKGETERRLDVEVTLDQFAELFAVFVFHVDEFDAVAFGSDVAHYGSEMNFAKAGANLESEESPTFSLLGDSR